MSDWTNYCIPRVTTNKFEGYPLSDITFSILSKGRIVNPSRFAIGIFNPNRKDINKFKNTVYELTGVNLKLRQEPLLVGIGVDGIFNEDKIYIYNYDEPIINAYTFTNKRFIESKHYNSKSFGVMGYGSRGNRKQINVELEDEKAIRYMQNHFKKNIIPKGMLLLGTKIIKSGLFSLDTVSLSKKRGCGYYFD